MREQLALLPGYLTAHLQLALFALLVGIVVSIPLGVWAARERWLGAPILAVAGMIQTIPSLALLALMVPIFAAMRMQSIGYLPAFTALVLYSILPVLRNTVTGLRAVEPALLEAARGVGMTSRQRLFRVEIPLAMPTIIAGIRTSVVWTVGIATLSTAVGATSLGNYIFSGLQTRNLNAVVIGCVAAAALALLLDGLIHLVAVGLETQRHGLLALALGATALLYAYAGTTLGRDLFSSSHRRVIVGAKTFTEQYILSEIVAGQIARATNRPVDVKASLGSTVAFDALRLGEIDAYVDYSGTIWATIMHRDTIPANRSDVLREVEQFLGERYGIVVVGTLGFQNAYVLAMRKDRAESASIRQISDLNAQARSLSMGADYEFFARPEWRALQHTYGLHFAAQKSMDPSLLYQAIEQGNVDVISAFSTDGRIAALKLVVLDDNQGAIPPYEAILLASKGWLDTQPEALAALRALVDKIDDGTMRQLNATVDEDGETPEVVAKHFLRKFQ